MNKNILKSFYLIAIILFFNSCEKKEFVQINPDAKITTNLTESTLILSENTANDVATVITWDKPDYGFDAAPSYAVLIDFANGDFTSAQVIPVGSALTKSFTQEELNAKLLTLGVSAGSPVQMAFKIQSKLSNYKIIESNPIPFTVTAYSSILDLSTEWGVVGSATPGAWGTPDIPDLPFYKTSTMGVIVAYVSLRNGEIKFRKNNDWTVNVGDDNADGTLEANGANIAVTAGTYKILFDTGNMTYTMEEFSWGIVGSGTANGWSGPDVVLTYNSFEDNWKAAVTLLTGEIKFRKNNDWAVNYGDTGADGSLEANGDNIAVTAGNYIVTFDPVNLTYSLEATDLWGLVGDATPNGWAGPDTKFLPDFGTNPDVYYINGITLTTGEIKVRQNDAWAVNYGDTGNDGTLESGGDNIPVTAGTYNVKIDFSASPPTITMAAWQ